MNFPGPISNKIFLCVSLLIIEGTYHLNDPIMQKDASFLLSALNIEKFTRHKIPELAIRNPWHFIFEALSNIV